MLQFDRYLEAMLAGVLLAAMLATAVHAEPAYLVDTHVHIDPQAVLNDGIAAAIKNMDRFGIRRIVLMPPPQPQVNRNGYDVDVLRSTLDKYPGRIALAGGGGTSGLNAQIHAVPANAVTEAVARKFRADAERLIAEGAVAFGEIAVQHLSLRPMGPRHPYEVAAADHPLLLLLADIAAAKNVPIDIHLDMVPEDMPLPDRPVFNPSNPSTLPANLAAFERLLDHNRNAKIIWAHAGTDPIGTRTPAVERELLQRHPNLYMSLRVSRGAPPPVFAMDADMNLKPVWLTLIRDFPDRFVLGSDIFYGSPNDRGGGADQEPWNFWRLVCQLPADLGDRVAYRNAEEIYRLPHEDGPHSAPQKAIGCSNLAALRDQIQRDGADARPAAPSGRRRP